MPASMDSERRKQERLGLAIPVRVQGYLAGGATWEELSTTIDVSERGACFPLNHPLELGHVLRLTLAMPKRLRSYDTTDSSYRVYSLVRSVERRSERARVGVLFFGRVPSTRLPGASRRPLPPAGRSHAHGARGLEDGQGPNAGAGVRAGAARGDRPGRPVPGAPAPEFLPSADERRTEVRASCGSRASRMRASQPPRIDVFVNFMLQLTDTEGAVLQQELTVADNVSRGGARVMTALSFQVGDVVLLQEAGGAFSTRAEIRAVTRVQPTYERLHLRFMDRQAPDRLLH